MEQRKVMKHYLDFVKSSQRFYRGYIQRLASRFGGIPEVEAVAHQFHVSGKLLLPAYQCGFTLTLCRAASRHPSPCISRAASGDLVFLPSNVGTIGRLIKVSRD